MKPGDVAGLALLNLPYSWIGIKREADGLTLEQYDQATGKSVHEGEPCQSQDTAWIYA